MTTTKVSRRTTCFQRPKIQSIILYSLMVTSILGFSVAFTGCEGEVLSDSFTPTQSTLSPSVLPPDGENLTSQKVTATRSESTDLGGTEPSTDEIEPSKDDSANVSVERKETKRMWFASKNGAIEHVNAANFRTVVLEADVPVLVDFYADWCGPCRALAPVLEQLAQETQNVRIVKVNVDQSPTLAAQYRVSAIPTLIVFNQGKPVQRMTGLMSKEELKRVLAVK
ncbi:MAG: thioredoxin [Thermogutta sp.]